jgi:peptidoglycan/xylan/chitin deacetylase (PgdA/CDA1 family)
MVQPTPTAIPILLYHSLSANATQPYRRFSMDPGRFSEQMEHIAAGGYKTMTVAELIAAINGPAGSMPERPLVLTFDDGFEDMHSVALPVLTRLGLHSTAYVVTAYLGSTARWLAPLGEADRPMLCREQVRDLDAAGVEIGSHTCHHIPLDEIGFLEAVREIHRSRRRLERIIGHPIASFAYPYGYHTGRIKNYLKSSGLQSACGVKQALSHDHDDQFALARAIVGSDTPMETLDAWIRGEELPLSRPGERPQTSAWRLARRMKRAVWSGTELREMGRSHV